MKIEIRIHITEYGEPLIYGTNNLFLLIYYSFLREPFVFFYKHCEDDYDFNQYKLNRKIFGRLKSGDFWKDNFETVVCEMFERRIENETNS